MSEPIYEGGGEWEPKHAGWSTVQDFHLAVADWLENVAATAVVVEHSHAALAVARAYLGRDS